MVGGMGLLKASQRHADYVVEARDRKPKGGTYHAFGPGDRVVQKGDIICMDRTEFIDIRDQCASRMSTRPYFLHSDIVSSIKTENGKLFAGTIGGNVAHTVGVADIH